MHTEQRTPAVVHGTTVVERRFPGVAPAVVFVAWADPAQRAQWDLPGGDEWVLAELTQDFRVGGRESARFGPPDDPRYWSAGEFLAIVPDARIVSAGVMHDGPTPISATLCTVELRPDDGDDGGGTRLVLTDQSAFFGRGETPADRRSGWGEILDRLVRFVERRGG